MICSCSNNTVNSLLKLYQEGNVLISFLKHDAEGAWSLVARKQINSDDIIHNPSMPSRNISIHSQHYSVNLGAD